METIDSRAVACHDVCVFALAFSNLISAMLALLPQHFSTRTCASRALITKNDN